MANTIIIKHRSADATAPSGLAAGEIAANINASGKKFYIGDGTGNIVFADQTYIDNGFQPLEATLTGLAATAPTANQMLYATGADTFATTSLTSFARDLLDDADAGTARTTLGAQASNAILDDLSALATTAGNTIRADGSDYVAVVNNIGASVAPTTTDDSGSGYVVGSLWIDTTADKAYMCVDATASAAVWHDITVSPDAGGALLTWGTGISGTNYDGSTAVTAALDFTELTDMTGSVAGTTELIINDAGTESRKAISEIDLSAFNNDSGWTSNTGTVTSVTVAAGTGLSGGGTITTTGTATLDLDFSELTDKTTAIAGTTEFILQDGSTESRKAASEIDLSAFNNDSGWTSNTGTVTSVSTSGSVNGITLTGGDITTTGTVTLGGTLGNITVSQLAGAAVVTEAEGIDSSDNDTSLPTTAAVKDYVDTEIATVAAGGLTYKGAYNANTNSPDLDTSPSGVLTGDMYTVTVAGTFFATAVEVGDVLIATADSASTTNDWVIVQANIAADNSSDWNTAYDNMIVSGSTTGGSSDLTLTQQDAGTVVIDMSNLALDGGTY